MPDGGGLVIGANNTGNATTRLTRNGAAANTAHEVINQNGNAILGRSGAGGMFPPAPVFPCGVWGDAGRGPGVYGTSNYHNGIEGRSTYGSGVYGSSYDLPGVEALSINSPGVDSRSTNSAGVYGESINSHGVHGTSTNSLGVSAVSRNSDGLFAISDPGTAFSSAVFGFSGAGFGAYVRSITNTGLFAASSTGLAAQFFGSVEVRGDVTVTGTVTGNKAFRIDHPRDPQNKYLRHACVESSQMKNLYDGVVELDEEGAAWVDLPEWFGELNRDYRYQLTAIGQPAPELHIAEEVSENHFRIAGGEPGMKISWQLTGIRKDRWAEANPIEVEQDKPEQDQGRYLHPELYGEPEERGIGWPTDWEEQQRRMEEQVRQTEELKRRMEEREDPPQTPEPPPGTDFDR